MTSSSSSNTMTLADILNSLSSTPITIHNSPIDTEFATNSIAELIRKRRNRLDTEKLAKSESPELAVEEMDANCDASSPPKMIKLDEEQPISSATNDSKVEQQQQQISAIASEKLSIDTSESSSFNTPDSLPLSFISNLSSFCSQWSQASSISSTAFSPALLSTPTSSPPLPIIPQKTIGDEFATVCGRLSLLNSPKYVITVGEMARRIFGKEEFSFSLLGGILRRAKTPNSTNALKSELEAVGIQIERGRRRNSRLSLFGGLVEGEAVQLGNDFNALLNASFPSQIIARYLEEAATAEQERLKRIEDLKIAKSFVDEFLNILNHDSSPIMTSYPIPTLPDSIQNPLTNFSIMTHGFGMIAVKSVMEMYGKILDEQILALSS